MWFKHQKRGFKQHTWWFLTTKMVIQPTNVRIWPRKIVIGSNIMIYTSNKCGKAGHQINGFCWIPQGVCVCVPSSGFVTSFPLAPQWATIGQNNAKEYWGYLQILGGQSPSHFFNLQKVNKMEPNSQSNIIQPHLVSLHWTMGWCSTLWTLRSRHLELNHPQCDGLQSATLGSNCGGAITMEAQHEQERLKHG